MPFIVTFVPVFRRSYSNSRWIPSVVYYIRTNSARHIRGISPILNLFLVNNSTTRFFANSVHTELLPCPWRQRAAYLACLFVSSLILSLQFTYAIVLILYLENQYLSWASQTSFWVIGPTFLFSAWKGVVFRHSKRSFMLFAVVSLQLGSIIYSTLIYDLIQSNWVLRTWLRTTKD